MPLGRLCALPSKALESRLGVAIFGCSGSASGDDVRGSTTVAVTMMTSSTTEWLKFFERKRSPRMGMLEIPGILLMISVVRWSSRPETMKLCPFWISTSVSVCRVDSAGMVKPEMVTALV